VNSKRRTRQEEKPLVLNEALRGQAVCDRVMGAIVLRLLRKRDEWIHRRVESVSVSDPVVTERRVSVDFMLGPSRPIGMNGDGEEVHLVPLTFMRKEPMVKFSLMDETGKAMPILTYHQNSAVSLSVLVVLGEALARSPESPLPKSAFPIPEDVIKDLKAVVAGDPRTPQRARERIENQRCHAQMSEKSIRWRDFLAGDSEFMKALDLFSNLFLLVVPLVGEVGVRRILKYTFEEHGDQPRLKLPGLLRPFVRAWARVIAGKPPEGVRYRSWVVWLARGIGWWPMASRIRTPLMGEAGMYHFEVEAAEGLQITLAQLWTNERRTDSGQVIEPRLVDQCTASRQRVHLYSRVNESGFVEVAARPRGFTIVRTGLMASVLSVIVLGVICAFSDPLLENVGAAISVLLLAPAVLAAYIARPISQPATNEAVFGLRMLATFSGVWPLLAALNLAAGTNCSTVAARPGHTVESVCTGWTYQHPSLWLLLGLAIVNSLMLLMYMTRVNRPPEQQEAKVQTEEKGMTS
jgi:hypothetical protein